LSIAVITSEAQRQALLPPLRCAAAGFHVTIADSPSSVPWESLLFAVVDENHAAGALQMMKDSGSRARVLLLGSTMSQSLVKLALSHHRVVGICASASATPEPWETTYITRRVLAPAEPTPSASQFLTWGVTNITWTPKSTNELRRVVKQIEEIAKNLGVERREASVISGAAHELLMNAMYDAPVNEAGQAIFAFDRKADVHLTDSQRPTFRLAVGPTYVGLDVSDPFGRLPRNKFFESVLRGQHARSEAPMLDTSHGGAGLGLFTLYNHGSVLRAELRPLQQTHVSWMLRRGLPHRPRDSERSLYFVALTEGR
jgi:hypothetical protein